MIIVAHTDPTTGLLVSPYLEWMAALPASNAVEITDTKAGRTIEDSGYPHSCYKPDGNGSVTLDPTASAAFDLANAKAAQIDIIKAACQAAQEAPISFTPNGGSAATFLMDAVSQHKYLGAYVQYASKGQAPSASTEPFYDENGMSVQMSAADISAFGDQVYQQIQAALAKQEGYFKQIKAAATPTDVAKVVWA